mgnify:CR=1 FL=1
MNFEDINILGNVLNDTWGSSNDDAGGSFKVVGKITGENKMTITCFVVVNLLNREEMQKEVDKAYDQLDKAANQYLKEVKSEFKSLSGRALKTKDTGHQPSAELINMSAYSQKGTALVRCIYSFDIE